MTTPPPGGLSEADRLILEAAAGLRRLTPGELQRVLDHVAQAGFDPSTRSRVGRLAAGVVWQGRVLRASDRLPPAESHYVRHVLGQQEWPRATTLQEYLQSIREVVLDHSSGVLISRYQGAWQLSVVRRSGSLRGPAGSNWILVEYRVGLGHWVTAYQPQEGLRALMSPERTDRLWLRRPT